MAENLYQYLSSFTLETQGMVDISKIGQWIQKWHDKFEHKYDLDPNFIYKTEVWEHSRIN